MPNKEFTATEFSIIDKYFNFSQASNHSGLTLGIGDDAAVVSGHDTVSNLSCELLRSDIDINHQQSAAMSLLQLESLIKADNTTSKKYLLLNISLPEINEEWLEHFSIGLHKILKTHNIVLAGGDTTSGSAAVVYQLFKIDTPNV